MDQVKEYLQLALKYRFWIVVAIAALLPVIAYAVAAGPITQETEGQVGTINTTHEGVKKYASNPRPINRQYQPVVQEKTTVLTKDVHASWRKLFDRQAPLLTWPEEVADRIPVWGREWPEGSDPTVVTEAVLEYIYTYRPYVDRVYASFRPFDFETGEGIVVAPSKEALLRYPIFEETKPPSLGKVWDTQQRLWVQGTVLDVIAKVNERAGAKDWPTAPIKQILALEVADPKAQDQKSFAQGVALIESPDVLSPEAAEAAAATETGGMGESSTMMGGAMGPGMGGAQGPGMSGAMGMSMGMGMGMGMGMSQGPRGPEPFMIYEEGNQEQAFVVPIHIAVYVEQERIPDLLVEFQNSPMNIEVLDFKYQKPKPFSVVKPKKGDQQPGGMGLMGMGGMMMGMSGGYGSMDAMMGGGYGGAMGMMGMSGGYGGMDGAYGTMGMGSMSGYGMPGSAGGAGAVAKQRTAKDVRSETLKRFEEKAKGKTKKGEEDEEEETKDASKTADPYYNVVRVDIYGRARFYMPPPPEDQPETEAELDPEMLGETDDEAIEVGDPAMDADLPATTDDDAPVSTDPADEPPAAPDAPATTEPGESPAGTEPPAAPVEVPGTDAPAEATKGETPPADQPKAETENPN